MTKYHRRVPPEVKEAYLREHVNQEELRTVDVLTLFEDAQRIARDQYSRQVLRQPTLEELEDPRKRREE